MKRLFIDLTREESDQPLLNLPPLPEELWLEIIICAVERRWRDSYGQQRWMILNLFKVSHQWRRLTAGGLSRVRAIDSSVLGWLNIKKSSSPLMGLNKAVITKLSYYNCASPHNSLVSQLTSLSALVFTNRWVPNGNTPQINFASLSLTSLRSMALVTAGCAERSNIVPNWAIFAPHVPWLTELNLTGCDYRMQPNAFRAFTALRSLVLRGNQDAKQEMLWDENAPSLHSTLTHLDIGRTPLSNWGGTKSKRITGLSSLTRLQSLTVDCNGARDARSWTKAAVARNLKSVRPEWLTIMEPYAYHNKQPEFPLDIV